MHDVTISSKNTKIHRRRRRSRPTGRAFRENIQQPDTCPIPVATISIHDSAKPFSTLRITKISVEGLKLRWKCQMTSPNFELL